MVKRTYVFMKGLSAPVDLSGCPDVVAILPEILAFWPFEILNKNAGDAAFFVVRPHKSGYVVGSPYFEKPKTFPDALNTVCALVAELAWEQIRATPALLCIHAAAVEINGRLLLIPNKRRAGKSTLTAALAARGYRVFTDDFLPLMLNDRDQLCGVASGISPRLRLPLPAGFGPENAAFVADHQGPSNRQYQYLQLCNTVLASKDDMLPIGGILVLNRDDSTKLAMSIPEPAEVLRALITQNFAREMNSSGVLRSLEFLVFNAQCHELDYAESGQTLDLIEETFAPWDRPIAVFDTAANTTDFQVADFSARHSNVIDFQPNDPLAQSTGVTIRDVGCKKFLSDQNGMAIHQLNETSAAIWQLLDEPTSLQQLSEIFQQAFPDHDAQAMCDDIRQTLKQMSKAGLVRHAIGAANEF